MSWQMDMLKKLQGLKPSEMTITMSGRNIGKSILSSQQAIDRLMRDLMNHPVQKIVLAEGTVYGKRYYTAEPVGGNWREMESWCSEMFGETGSIWNIDQPAENQTPIPNSRWYMNNRKFWFRDDQDRMIFVLKWR